MIAAYNAGPGNVAKWLSKNPEINKDPSLFIESIPFAETRKYVGKVMANYWMYQSQFGHETPTLKAMAKHRWPSKIKLSLR